MTRALSPDAVTARKGGDLPVERPAEWSVRAQLGGYLTRLRGGEVGSMPVVVGLVALSLFFQSQNDHFLTAGNLTNLLVQGAGVAMIAMGVVFVLLIGELDLSVGSMAGVGGAVLARTVTGPHPHSWWLGIALALLAGAAMGFVQGVLVTALNLPSFVVTLAGLLAFNGIVLEAVNNTGRTSIRQVPQLVYIGNGLLTPTAGWILALVATAGYAALQVLRRRRRLRLALKPGPALLIVWRVAVVAVVATAVLLVTNADRGPLAPIRGLPFVVALVLLAMVVLSYLASRTSFGRHVYAVGGHAEAARRAGIKVQSVRVGVFMLSGVMATVGGIVLTSRLQSVTSTEGSGQILLYAIAAAVVGGTSLFGGHGRVVNAVLGGLVVAAIDNGMGLLELSAGSKSIYTGIVLIAAVTIDSLSRRGRVSSGRG
ncbi:MAG: D-xylose transport system permease protein [Frankiales bacterium]|jgi:D-xylose transport system permease protein|nr:D-xylose transport system permease protein [Frankiales bacterium]